MKAVISLFTFLFISQFTWSAGAQDLDEAFAEIDGRSAETMEKGSFSDKSPVSFLLGYRYVNVAYDEGDIMNQKGDLSGLGAALFYRLSPRSLLRMDGEYLTGSLTYSGAISDGYSRTAFSAKDEFVVKSLSAVYVSSSDWTSSFVTSPFIGLGYRDTLDNKSGEYDYTRDITYNYLILGTQFEVVNDRTKLVMITAELNLLFAGGAKTYLSEVNPNYRDIDLKFKSGNALKLGVESFFTVFETHRIAAEASYKVWNINQSTTEQASDFAYFIEPANKTALTSLTLGYLF